MQRCCSCSRQHVIVTCLHRHRVDGRHALSTSKRWARAQQSICRRVHRESLEHSNEHSIRRQPVNLNALHWHRSVVHTRVSKVRKRSQRVPQLRACSQAMFAQSARARWGVHVLGGRPPAVCKQRPHQATQQRHHQLQSCAATGAPLSTFCCSQLAQ